MSRKLRDAKTCDLCEKKLKLSDGLYPLGCKCHLQACWPCLCDLSDEPNQDGEYACPRCADDITDEVMDICFESSGSDQDEGGEADEEEDGECDEGEEASGSDQDEGDEGGVAAEGTTEEDSE